MKKVLIGIMILGSLAMADNKQTLEEKIKFDKIMVKGIKEEIRFNKLALRKFKGYEEVELKERLKLVKSYKTELLRQLNDRYIKEQDFTGNGAIISFTREIKQIEVVLGDEAND